MSITVNSNEVCTNINNLLNSGLNSKLNEALQKACAYIEGEAKKNCPTDTGNLRNSITYDVDGLRGEVGSLCEYAPYVEIGTGIYSKQGIGRQTPWVYRRADGTFIRTKGEKPQPYLKPAVDANISTIGKLFEGLL